MILVGDCLEHLRTLPSESVNCCVTSPPYYGLRDYGVAGQIGQEETPRAYVARLVEVFEEVRRVLRADGTCWVNLGDSYADKSLMGIPWRVAFALQDAGWYLRSDIIWAKPNPMPESVTDRPTKAHEYLFLLTKSSKYWYDAAAIAEAVAPATVERVSQPNWENQEGSDRVPGKTNGNMKAVLPRFGGAKYGDASEYQTCSGNEYQGGSTRNSRTVWGIATQPYKEAHFAPFPEEIPRRCISAGCPVGGTVLDPFLGSGTTGAVATRLGREYIGIELNPEYAELARKRISRETPSLFKEAA